MHVLAIEVEAEEDLWLGLGLPRAWMTLTQQPFSSKPLPGILCKGEAVPCVHRAQSCQQSLPHLAQSAFGIDRPRPETQQVSVLV